MSWDTRFYLDVNRLARQSHWAHWVAHWFALYAGVAVLALLVLLACVRARPYGGQRTLAAAIWAGLGALAAFGLAQPLSHAIGRVHPYDVLHHVLVLVPRTGGFAVPNGRTSLAGAVAVGLWLARDRLLASLATLVALAVAFDEIYVGAAYPLDVAAGLAFGGVVVGAGYLAAVPVLEAAADLVARTPLRTLVGARRHGPPAGVGPAARPATIRETGAVRILEGVQPSPRVPAPRPGASGGGGVAGS